jgi:hypothetical protein
LTSSSTQSSLSAMAAYMTGVLPYSSTLSTGTAAVQWRYIREWEEKPLLYIVVNGEEVGSKAKISSYSLSGPPGVEEGLHCKPPGAADWLSPIPAIV